MLLRTALGRIGLFSIIVGIAACSSGGQSASLPATRGNANTQTVTRTTQSLRAFAADCSATSALAMIGLCTNIELAGSTVYGPTTPAQDVPGFHPADLRSAYALPSTTAGSGQTIGVVIVNNAPNVAADLAVYRSTFGLPVCGAETGCLRVISAKINPTDDKDWSREAATDLDMASAVCPNCQLILYEAKSTKDTDLAAAVSAVIAAGATVVSNSYVVPESNNETNSMWSHPGVPIVAASGDHGPGTANWPAAAAGVIAVGGTTLRTDATTARGWSESVWTSSGSGCSLIVAKPAWQPTGLCPQRSIADVAAVSDPSTPVAIYDSYQDNGWVEVGGTSVATPIVAGVYALAGNGSKLNGAASIYAHASALYPILGGTSAGVGSPNGVAAF